MTDKEVMQMALAALIPAVDGKAYTSWAGYGWAAIEALRAALAQPEHLSDCAVHNEPAYPAGECDCKLPVAWADKHDVEREGHDFHVSRQRPAKDGVPLYAAQREWVGLTDEEIKRYKPVCADFESFRAGVKAVEIKIKGKNGY